MSDRPFGRVGRDHPQRTTDGARFPGRIPIDATNPHLRRIAATAVTALVALLAPAAAQAAGSSALVYFGVLNYNAAPGAANHVGGTSTGSTGWVTRTGAGVSITPGYGSPGSGSTVTCNGVWSISVN